MEESFEEFVLRIINDNRLDPFAKVREIVNRHLDDIDNIYWDGFDDAPGR